MATFGHLRYAAIPLFALLLGLAIYLPFRHTTDDEPLVPPSPMPGLGGPTVPPPVTSGSVEGTRRGPQIYNLAVDTRFKSGITLRPMDTEIFQIIAKGDYQLPQMADLFPDRPYRVKLVGSPTERWINGVLVDLDRDGKWDETWVLKTDAVYRKTTQGHDPQHGIPFTLRNGRWLPY